MKQAAKELDFERAAAAPRPGYRAARELVGGETPEGLQSLAAQTRRPDKRSARSARGGRMRRGRN